MEKVYRTASRRNQVQASSCPPPVKMQGQCLILPAVVCDRLPIKEVHLDLSVQGFYWESLCAHVTDSTIVTPALTQWSNWYSMS